MGPTEIIVIAAMIVLLFGASKIPLLGRNIGEGISNLRRGLKEGSADPALESAAVAERSTDPI